MVLAVLPIQALSESPITPASTLGPYRRADYERLPEEPRCELIYGRFYLSPSPTPFHQLLVRLLSRRLGEIADRTGNLLFFAPMDTELSDHTVVQPDLLYILKEREGIVGDRVEGAPDLVVEVLSPGTARYDRSEKLSAYAELGVREYWIVNGGEREIDFLVSREERFQVVSPRDGLYRSEIMPEIEIDLADFWSEVDRRTPSRARAERP